MPNVLQSPNQPDSNDLAHVQRVVIKLSDEDGRHRLIERCAVHVDGGAHWEHEASDSLVDAVVLLSTAEGDGQRSRAETHETLTSFMDLADKPLSSEKLQKNLFILTWRRSSGLSPGPEPSPG